MLQEVLSPARLSAWVPPAAGALCAALVFLAARSFRPLSPPTAPSDRPQPPAPPPRGRPRERRSHQRRPGTWVPVLLSDAEGEAEPVRGAVLDRSAAGLALAVEASFQPGTVLGVRAVEHFQEMPWVPVTVRNCRRKGEGYVLGCELLGPQPWSVLVLFG